MSGRGVSFRHCLFFSCFDIFFNIFLFAVFIFWEETYQDWVKDWSENFHGLKSMNRLCLELSPHITERDTNYRKAIAVRHQVAITLLYWLADTHHRTIGNLWCQKIHCLWHCARSVRGDGYSSSSKIYKCSQKTT